MTPNEKQEKNEENNDFELPAQVTVYTDPNSGLCESCQ